ncbi:MAG: hypothetical protein D6729_10605 [Deltaproteobacteria bacterium]|nr:MAG: hypothetical protein D6729_10605 [Deltaproteobacteria bacterium]
MLRVLPLALFLAAACSEEKPAETRSFFEEGGQAGAAKAAGMPEGHPATGAAPAGGAKAGLGGTQAGAAAAQPIVQGTITLGEAQKDSAPVGVLFIMARMPAQGEMRGPPILVKKVNMPKFPYPFELTTADVMMQGMPVPEKLVVQVRLDQDGDAISRTPGDLYGEAKGLVDKGATGVQVVLDTRVEESKPGRAMGPAGARAPAHGGQAPAGGGSPH